MPDLILDHPIFVSRWLAPLLVAVMIALTFAVFLLLRRLKSPTSHRMVKRAGLTAAILGFLACGLVLVLRLGPLAPLVETVGRFARWKGAAVPNITLTRVRDGSPLRLASFRGRVMILNIWATWCPPCRSEMPDLVRLENSHAGGEVAVIAISDEPAEKQLKFSREHALPKNAAVGTLGWNTGTFRPFTLIVDRQGKVREFYFGAQDFAFFEKRVRALL